MRTSELMIGDFVMVDGKIRKIVQLTRKKIGYHDLTSASNMRYSRIGMVKPIPIDEKFLVDNGFKEMNQTDMNIRQLFRYVMGGMIRVSLFYNQFFSFSIDDEDTDTLCNSYAKYIHEFQHLVKLSGVKFEANVPYNY